MNIEQIKQIVENEITNAEVYVEGMGAKFMVIAVSDEFEGVTQVNRQRRIYKALNTFIESGEIHALTIKAKTTKEWQSDKIKTNE